jgi:hypothetical protein
VLEEKEEEKRGIKEVVSSQALHIHLASTRGHGTIWLNLTHARVKMALDGNDVI